jgi:hypothetical protein
VPEEDEHAAERQELADRFADKSLSSQERAGIMRRLKEIEPPPDPHFATLYRELATKISQMYTAGDYSWKPDEVLILARAVIVLSDDLARERGVKLW